MNTLTMKIAQHHACLIHLIMPFMPLFFSIDLPLNRQNARTFRRRGGSLAQHVVQIDHNQRSLRHVNRLYI
jgi:hypothetical protein